MSRAASGARSRAVWIIGSLTLVVAVAGGAWLAVVHRSAPSLTPVPLVRQATPYTCGVAALQSILAYFGNDIREDELAMEVKADPEEGTDHREMVRAARKRGLPVEVRENMTVDSLRAAVGAGHPVVVAIQAWGDRPEKYDEGWEDGHYCIVIGIDRDKVYLMDPSTIGNYTFIPIQEFVSRWHDYYMENGRRVNLVHLGMIFRSEKTPPFDPRELKRLR